MQTRWLLALLICVSGCEIETFPLNPADLPGWPPTGSPDLIAEIPLEIRDYPTDVSKIVAYYSLFGGIPTGYIHIDAGQFSLARFETRTILRHDSFVSTEDHAVPERSHERLIVLCAKAGDGDPATILVSKHNEGGREVFVGRFKQRRTA